MEKDVLETVARKNLTGKHLCYNPCFNNVAGCDSFLYQAQVFSQISCVILVQSLWSELEAFLKLPDFQVY